MNVPSGEKKSLSSATMRTRNSITIMGRVRLKSKRAAFSICAAKAGSGEAAAIIAMEGTEKRSLEERCFGLGIELEEGLAWARMESLRGGRDEEVLVGAIGMVAMTVLAIAWMRRTSASEHGED